MMCVAKHDVDEWCNSTELTEKFGMEIAMHSSCSIACEYEGFCWKELPDLIWAPFLAVGAKTGLFPPLCFYYCRSVWLLRRKKFKTSWRKFLKFDTYVQLDPKMDCLNFGNLGSSVKATLKDKFNLPRISQYLVRCLLWLLISHELCWFHWTFFQGVAGLNVHVRNLCWAYTTSLQQRQYVNNKLFESAKSYI